MFELWHVDGLLVTFILRPNDLPDAVCMNCAKPLGDAYVAVPAHDVAEVHCVECAIVLVKLHAAVTD